jgi:uncharacterized protein YfaS (alpha-2-macroglobulin family)
MLAAADNALRQIAADDSGDTLVQMRQRAYAIYLLTRQGNVTTNDLASVQRRLQEVHPKEWKGDLAAAWLAASYQMLHQDRLAADLMAAPRKLLGRKPADETYAYAEYYDAPIRDATVLYLLSKHFPEQAKALPPETIENLVRPLGKGHYNTLSSGMIILALDAWAKDAGGDVARLSIGAVAADGKVTPIGAPRGALVDGRWAAGTQRLRMVDDADATAWYAVSQTGFDRKPAIETRKDGLEITRAYTDAKGKAVDTVNTGDEIDVHLRIRSTRDEGVPDVAIVDLLPGGFEPVLDTAPPAPAEVAVTSEDDVSGTTGEGDEGDEGDEAGEATDETPTWHSPVGTAASTWTPQYADVREDRVVVYGYASRDVQEFVYRIKATNAGRFTIPPVFAESLYDRGVLARAPGGGAISVERKP